ncbi:hypothetical protein OE88DRAFT_1779786 [Heliocybe sulcata]|uniref:DUF6534 domain-containing protein n=1 Tax=Heliocybe sulcata TaxID=5364 RepID=A0A5C3NGE6_9AGAM|nr:hypothetical protein OE88DRAFT_1779786 [Heliocybe sulcata]
MTTTDNLAGSMLVCMLVAAIVYGMTMSQTLYYYQNYPNDSRLLKYTVAAISLMETIHIAFCIYYIYFYVITNFSSGDYLERIHWRLPQYPYYIRRVYIMSNGNIVLTSSISFLALLRIEWGLTSTQATATLSYLVAEWSTFAHRRLTLATLSVALSSAILVDLTVAASLIYFLRTRRTGFSSTDNRIRTIMAYIINTGALTGIVSVMALISFFSFQTTLVWLGLVEIQSKLYANAFLGSLNARKIMRDRHQSTYLSADNPAPSSRGLPHFATMRLDTRQSKAETTPGHENVHFW